MSSIAVTASATGTGVVSLVAPVTNTNRTLTLPDATGTLLSSATTTGFPAGTVLQVVANSYATQTSTTSGSAQPSGLSASITPSSASSKILVMIADPVRKGGTNITGMQLFVYRNGSNVFQPMTNFAYTNPSTADFSGLASFWYLDSPASSSAVTYALYFSVNNVGSGATAYTQIDGNNGYITLMEIAA